MSFRNPKGPDGPAFLPHDAAIGALRQCLGMDMVVQSTMKKGFAETLKGEMQHLSQSSGTDFEQRAKQATVLSDSMASTGSILRGALQTIDKLLDECVCCFTCLNHCFV